MRPAGKGALESLYFDYPQFAARRVPELDGAVKRHQKRADRSQGHLQ